MADDSIAIRIRDLGKRYRIGGPRVRMTLRETLTRGVTAPLRRLGRGSGDAGGRNGGETLWALRDLSLDIRCGEVIGVIGRNGAGKTTLLKILSRITDPTTGRAEIRGRVGSLLEVGTGFHPELTGRENIYLSGAILGMRRHEIRSLFDRIVAFAEVDRFLETPVKRYSSGMYVRLAFAVAAHLNPEILLVDEVLAVGDAAFQAKCLGKMDDVAQEGRTVLFVSHNMAAVSRLCHRGLLLDGGRMVMTGDMGEVVARYTDRVMSSDAEVRYDPDPGKKIQLRSLRLLDHERRGSTVLDRDRPFRLSIEYEVRESLAGVHVAVMLDRADGLPVWHATDIDSAPDGIIARDPGRYRTEVEYPGGVLNAAALAVRVGIARYGGEIYDYREPFVFHLEDRGSFASVGSGGRQRLGVLAMPLEWRTETLGEVEA